MERKKDAENADHHRTGDTSPVKAMIAWLVEADREYRVAQRMVNETRNKM
ncbi:MAG: hypothetical protein AAGI36_13085 [Pseudomonadota bacterium]